MYDMQDNMDLPFLNIIMERKNFFPNPLKIIEDFVASQSGARVELCQRLFAGFDDRYAKREDLDGLDYFKNFGFTLLLVQYVSDLYWSKHTKSSTYKNFLSQFEIYLCGKVMDAVCNVSERLACKGNGMPYYIKSDFGNDFANYPAIE